MGTRGYEDCHGRFGVLGPQPNDPLDNRACFGLALVGGE
jgi:hypothetical protein